MNKRIRRINVIRSVIFTKRYDYYKNKEKVLC